MITRPCDGKSLGSPSTRTGGHWSAVVGDAVRLSGQGDEAWLAWPTHGGFIGRAPGLFWTNCGPQEFAVAVEGMHAVGVIDPRPRCGVSPVPVFITASLSASDAVPTKSNRVVIRSSPLKCLRSTRHPCGDGSFWNSAPECQ